MAKVNLKDVSSEGEPDVLLKSFDVVYVPMTKIARVDRFVYQHLKQTLPIALTAGFTYILGSTGAVFGPR